MNVDGAGRAAAVVVVGDGPAGSALAAACRARDVDVALVGDDAPWTATYCVWVDELDRLDVLGDIDVFLEREPTITAFGDDAHRLDRPYGVIDNQRLRRALRAGVSHVPARASSVTAGPSGFEIGLEGGGQIRSRLVIDATGRPPRFAGLGAGSSRTAWQTAFGVVLPEPPPGELGRATLMDFRRAGDDGPASFAYAVPVPDGWLVEETVLAARPAVDPAGLVVRLAARLGSDVDALLAGAVRTERVRIAMGGPIADVTGPIPAFGAAAGYVNPINGYSLAASLRRAGPVAAAVEDALEDGGAGPVDVRPVWDSIWPRSMRRTRVLHDYGLELLIRSDRDELATFFDSFFRMPPDLWAPYLRVDATPPQVSRLMTRLFRASSWSTRRRLAAGNPLPLASLVRP